MEVATFCAHTAALHDDQSLFGANYRLVFIPCFLDVNVNTWLQYLVVSVAENRMTSKECRHFAIHK